MSWGGTRGGAVDIASSASETARFGHAVERLTVRYDWEAQYTRAQLGERLRELLDASSAQTIILRYPSDAQFVPQELGDHCRQLYPAGTLLYWEHAGKTATRHDDVLALQSPEITTDALSQILLIVADAFDGYINHYSANPLIAPDAITAGYLEWAKSTVLHPQNRVFIVSDGSRPTGVAIVECADDGSHWEIQLAGIIVDAQGRGHYSRLVDAVLSTAHGLDVPRVVISTQAHNTRVQRAWVRLGFKPYAAIDTIHLVRPSA